MKIIVHWEMWEKYDTAQYTQFARHVRRLESDWSRHSAGPEQTGQ